MKRRDAALALTAAGLAPAAFAQGAAPVEGRHYVRLAQPLPGTRPERDATPHAALPEAQS